MMWSVFFAVITAWINIQIVSTQTKFTRPTKTNVFDPVLSANAYTGRIKENERLVQVVPRIYASDNDLASSDNGKICGYELSLHKHDDNLDGITQDIPFTVELNVQEAIIKLKSSVDKLDCEVKQVHRLFIRAFDCAPTNTRRYSERSSLTITVDDVNEHAPVFTNDHYLFKLHPGQTCDPQTCRIEATDDDCSNDDHRVCGYKILTSNVPFSIDSNGSISIRGPLNSNQYDFDVIAIDCFGPSDNTKEVARPARVTFKIIPSCTPMITDIAPSKLLIQSDLIHLFDTVNVNTCAETCYVEDIVGTVELNSTGLDSGCNPDQCSTTTHEYVLLPKDGNAKQVPQANIMSFNGYNQATIINQSQFSGHLNNEFLIRMWMKHTSTDDDDSIGEKEHVFCKSDEQLKNRHHAALIIQNNDLKLLIRKGPVASNDVTLYTSEWIWTVPQINDNQWHSYKFKVNYPEKIDLYIDEKLIVPTDDNFRVVRDIPLLITEGTDDTIFALGACWHARGSRFVQHFRGQLSGLTIEQKEELQRSSSCIRDCHQYLDITGIQSAPGLEFVSNSNRSMWMLRTDETETYERLLKHLVYRNTFDPIGPSGQRTVTIRTLVKCLGEKVSHDLPTFTRLISIDAPAVPTKIELKADTFFSVPEKVMNSGIYLFRNLSIYINTLKKSQDEISDCTVTATPSLSKSELLIVPDFENLDKEITQNGVMINGINSIDNYQYFLRQIAYISRSPATFVDRAFTVSCAGTYDQIQTNEIRVRVHIEKQRAPPAPAAAILSDRFVVDNDQIRGNTFDIDEGVYRTRPNLSDWPIAVVICASIGLAGVLVLYLIVRVRSNHRQRNPTSNVTDDMHSQMEWEDDIGLNITVNPLDETKKSVQSPKLSNIEQTINEYAASSSDDDEYENEGHNRNEYSSDDDDENKQTHPKKLDHQLEWDDAAIEYGPKKV